MLTTVNLEVPFEFNVQQEAALQDILRWYDDEIARRTPYILQGFAGTGKTTILKELIKRICERNRLAFSRVGLAAPTNRAAKVLMNKTGLFASTWHKLIYRTLSEELDLVRGRLRVWDDALSFLDVGAGLIEIQGRDLREEYEEYQHESYDGETTLLKFDEYRDTQSRAVLVYEGLELPDNDAARSDLFVKSRQEKIHELKLEIRKLLDEDLQVSKREPADLILRYSLWVGDESSMINEVQGKDIASYGIPTIFVGDPFQLPPVKAKAFWDGVRPNSMLTKIERQKGDGAGIPLAGERIRNGKSISRNESLQIWPKDSLAADDWISADQIICGTHKVRERLCRYIRNAKGFKDIHPQVGEKVVAVFNDKGKGILNGELYTVVEVDILQAEKVVRMKLEDPYGKIIEGATCWVRGLNGRSHTDYLDDQYGKFWWGYAITCHQSQGSEWKRIIVCDDWPGDGHDRWLYTAITRASLHCDLIQ